MEPQQPDIPLRTFAPQVSRQATQEDSATLRGSVISSNRKDDGTFARQDSRERDASPEELAMPTLPPVDRGVKAWTFVAAAFALETLVWGFGFT